MLVLQRKIGESIVIDGGIAVTVVAVTGGRVKLGFEASKEIPVRRSELRKKAPDSVLNLSVRQ